MKLLPIAVEKRRWDLAAHAIILATASVLKNGDKPHVGRRVSSITIGGGSAVEKVTRIRGGEFGRKKRGAQR